MEMNATRLEESAIRVYASASERDAIKAAANQKGLTVSAWARMVLLREAERALGKGKRPKGAG